MADFASWVTAAEPGLGWNDREFLAAYTTNQHDVSESAFEADAVAVAIADFVSELHPAPAGWEGTATDLLNAINDRAPESTRKHRSWPFNGQGLGTRMDRIAPSNPLAIGQLVGPSGPIGFDDHERYCVIATTSQGIADLETRAVPVPAIGAGDPGAPVVAEFTTLAYRWVAHPTERDVQVSAC
jgi:hypothetical protein